MAIIAGGIIWYLPWAAWTRWAAHLLAPGGLVFIGFGILASTHGPYLFTIFFCTVFAVFGIAHGRGIGLMMWPLLLVAYIVPVGMRSGDYALAGGHGSDRRRSDCLLGRDAVMGRGGAAAQ